MNKGRRGKVIAFTWDPLQGTFRGKVHSESHRTSLSSGVCDGSRDSAATAVVGPVCLAFLSEVMVWAALTSQGGTVIASVVTLAFKAYTTNISTNPRVLF